MGVNVDAINLEVDITGKGHLSFDGHFVNVEYDEESQDVTLFCSACGHSESLEGVPSERRWTAICYLLGHYEDAVCDGDGKDLEERLQKVLERYVGKPADQGRIAALETDVQDVVGEGVPVNIDVP